MRYEVEVKIHKDFVKIDGYKISVGVESRPSKGEANRELVRKLAKHFNVTS